MRQNQLISLFHKIKLRQYELFQKRTFTGQKLVYNEFGDPSAVIRRESLRLENIDKDKTVIKMLASPINPADINTIQGTYAVKPTSLPAVGGNEGVGIVKQLGSSANPFSLAEGDWVIPKSPLLGSWQSYIIGDNKDFIKVPSNMNLVTASTISVNPCTAYRMLKDFENLKPGNVVIQNGGNSAVGQAVIQLCREFSLKSISIIRQRENFKDMKKYLEDLGDKNTLIISEEELRTKRDSIEKAQLALNCVGGKSATEILRYLEDGKTIVTYGGMARQPVIIPTSQLIFRDIKVKGFWMTKWNELDEKNNFEERIKMLNFLSQIDVRGEWKPPSHKLIPLAKYRDALENCMKPFNNVKYIIKFEE